MGSIVVFEHEHPRRFAKIFSAAAVFFGSGFVRRAGWRLERAGAWCTYSVAIEDEDVTVFERNLDRLAGFGALVEKVRGWVIIVSRNPFPDGLPGRLDGLEGLDVERRVGRRRDVDDGFPEPMEAEEEFDFTGPEEGIHYVHDGVAAGALERVGAPHAEDEVAPEGAHGAGGGFRGWWDNGRFRCGRFVADGFRWRGGRARQAAAFVGVEAVVADGLLAFGWDVVDGGGDKVGGGKDFKIPFGAPTAAGAIDDGLGFGVPMDFLEGEGGAQEVFGEALSAFGVAGGDRFFPAVDVEAAVFPGEELGGLVGAEELGFAEDVEEAVTKELGDEAEAFGRHGVEAAFLIE